MSYIDNIKINKVEKSWLVRQFELLERLEKHLDSVKEFKVFYNKFHESLYYRIPDDANVTNKTYHDLAKTDMRYWLSKKYNNRLEMAFFLATEVNDILRFDIDDKSVPSILKGLSETKERMIRWKKDEHESTFNVLRLEDYLEKVFSCDEYTERKFENTRLELMAAFKDAMRGLDKLTYANVKSKKE